MPMNKKELGKRIAVSVLGIPVIFFATVFSPWTFLAMMCILLTLGMIEFYRLFTAKGFYPIFWIALLFINLFAFLLLSLQFSIFLVALFLSFIAVLLVELFRNKPNPVMNISVTLLGLLYMLLLATLLVLRVNPWLPGVSLSAKGYLILWIFSIIWICDTGAYFVGSLIGRHPLYPRVSPKKSWEGSLGGFLFSIVAAIFIGAWFVPFLPVRERIFIGMIVGIFGQISDLIESLFKRDSGVKDSSQLLPGHGGILDRFDSPLLVSPIVCLYFICRYYFF